MKYCDQLVRICLLTEFDCESEQCVNDISINMTLP